MSIPDTLIIELGQGDRALLNVILALIMFSVALDLTLRDFRRVLGVPRALLTGLAAQFLALPLLTFALILMARPQPSVAMGLILVAACPGGAISNFITHRAQGSVALSVSLTVVSTVGAILVTPLNITLWGNLYPPTRELLRHTTIDPAQVAVTVGLTLALPMLLGIGLNARLPALTNRIRRPLQWLSLALFVAFIVSAMAANREVLLGFAGVVIALVILHNALALAGGYGIAWLARLPVRDRRAISIETGIQNSALGLLLIFTFFDGLGGMALTAAVWGLWHGGSGLALASAFARRPLTD